MLSRVYLNNVNKGQVMCGSINGYLVEVDDEREFDHLRDFLRTDNPTVIYPVSIGMRKRNGHWRYINSGRDVTFTDWNKAQAGQKEDQQCVFLRENSGYKMNIDDCYPESPDDIVRAVCEVNG